MLGPIIINEEIPTLYIYGTQDPLLSDKCYSNIQPNGSKQTKILVKRGGHFSPRKDQLKSVRLINEFLMMLEGQ